MNGSPLVVVQAFVQAINRQDVDAIAALMAPDHKFTDSLGNVVAGREAMRAGWAAFFRGVPDYALAIEEFYSDGPLVVMLGVARGTYSPAGTLQEGNRWKTPAALRARVENGLIAEWRVYADNEPIREKMRLSAT